jgi:hypothetical protein
MTTATPLSAATASATIAAYQQLQRDLAGINLNTATSQQMATIQNDVVNYYSVQAGERGYAAMAAAVVSNSDYNGNVANANLAAGLQAQGYTGNALQQQMTQIEVGLAKADYATMTAGVPLNANDDPSYLNIPTITQIDAAHISVCPKTY